MSPIYVVFLCVLVTVWGETPEPCCLPKNWQAVMTNTSLINNDNEEFSYYYVDYTLKKDALVHMEKKPNSTAEETYRIVKDYNMGKMYVVLPNGKCYPSDYPLKMFSKCVPKSAKYLGADYVGLPSAGIPYDGWRWTEQNIMVTIAVIKETCVPLIEGIKGRFLTFFVECGKMENNKGTSQYPVQVNSVLFFSHYSSPVIDTSVFKVPKDC